MNDPVMIIINDNPNQYTKGKVVHTGCAAASCEDLAYQSTNQKPRSEQLLPNKQGQKFITRQKGSVQHLLPRLPMRWSGLHIPNT
jgi:hypothetical protein